MKKIFYLTVIFLLSIDLSTQQVIFCPTPEGYDLTNITIPGSAWEFNEKGQCIDDKNIYNDCTFSFSLCQALPSDGECKDSSVCQVSAYTNKTELGHFVSNPFQKKDVNGFYAIFNKTEPIVNKYTNKTCKLSIILEFDCNSNVPWISNGTINQSPKPTRYNAYTADSCEIYINFDYAGACYKIDPIVTTTIEPDAGDKKLSAGSILLIFFFVTLFTYLIIGSFYNKTVLRESGYYVIPNIRTWAHLLLLTIDGFVFTWRYITCQEQNKSSEHLIPTTRYEALD